MEYSSSTKTPTRHSMTSITLSARDPQCLATIQRVDPPHSSSKPAQSGERLHSLTATMENVRPTPSSDEALRRRRQQQQELASPTKRPLTDTANFPVKRTSNGQKTLGVAPDWGGNEITPPPSLTWGMAAAASTQMPPLMLTAAGYRDTANPLSLSNPMWGLKREVVIGFGACGIATMYPWQLACLSLPGLLAGEKNLVYTAPTSAGKSLVADVLMIRKVVIERKKAIVVVPYIAIVQEKTKFLKKVLERVKVQAEPRGEWDKTRYWRGLNIAGLHSGSKSRLDWEEVDVAVCTIEKANALVNASIESRTIDTLGIIVFDELHMLSDPHRGHVLELLATKILCLTDENIQIVGMSATLSNLSVVAKWLQAECYECTYRPIPLQEHLVYDNSVYNGKMELITHISPSELAELKDPVTNAVVSLACACVLEGNGVLVFCESRKRCEDLARLLKPFMPRPNAETNRKRSEVLNDLEATTAGMDMVLKETISSGVAFHHAGLTSEEKDLIAGAYDQGHLKVICCTATMAAGVNLPARRVIISPRMGRDFVTPAMLRQMKGRAGRKGKDTVGENFVVCRREDLETVRAIIDADMPSASSCLTGESEGLRRALLEGIATKLATSADSLDDFLRCTLLFHTTPTPVATLRPLITAALASLTTSNLITADPSTSYFSATPPGLATVAAGLSPDEGLFLHEEFSRALKAFNLESDLHIIYHFTPIHSSSTSSIAIDWKLLRDDLNSLSESNLRAATFIGVNPAFVNRMAQGGTLKEDTPANIEKARVYRRFYVALMLRQLINERPVHVVADSYDIARGFVQGLSTTCKGFATTSATFCKVMGWSGLAVLLEHYSGRLDLGVRDDLMELARIPFVKSWTARVFHENGLKTVAAVAGAEVSELVRVLELARWGRVGKDEEGVKKRLEERAEVILKCAKRLWDQDNVGDVDEYY
ncbi:P-loop containing nucleoside triphosphate hydrolase protein [Morchella snyderi]|nr:P-loop containing nucleoside triphosphate hydrolase protein [Morchella snyderi]